MLSALLESRRYTTAVAMCAAGPVAPAVLTRTPATEPELRSRCFVLAKAKFLKHFMQRHTAVTHLLIVAGIAGQE